MRVVGWRMQRALFNREQKKKWSDET
jgi:hypothetical protein